MNTRLENEIQTRGAQAVMNDNDQFHQWITGNLSLVDVLQRCPGVISEIMEEFNNDWIEAVETAAADMGLAVDPDLDTLLDDVRDEYGLSCDERGETMTVYANGQKFSVEYTNDGDTAVEAYTYTRAETVNAISEFCDLPARWHRCQYGADA